MKGVQGRPGVRLTPGFVAVLALAAQCTATHAAATAVTATQAGVRAERELSREQATALVQRRYAARVVRADVADDGGRRVYVFRLLSEGGKVWTVRIDAQSGAEVP